MITEKQKEAVKELCQYVDNFCKENDLSAFMSVAASEDHPDGLEQIAGSIITGKTELRRKHKDGRCTCFVTGGYLLV